MTGSNLLIELASCAKTIRLFLDYDGTLAEFAPSPDDVNPDKELIWLLRGLVSSKKILPAIISGRKLAHIQQLLPVQGLLLGGTYGIEMQLPDGEIQTFCQYENVRPFVDQVIMQWKALIMHRHGFFLEDKGWGVALHGLNASTKDAVLIYSEAQKILDQNFPFNTFRIVKGERFLELAPAVAEKSRAVRYILDEMTPADALSIYIGDDDKDEKAMWVVIESGGYGIRVLATPGETKAQFTFRNPSEVKAWLRALLVSSSG